jgi:hypothetical protein
MTDYIPTLGSENPSPEGPTKEVAQAEDGASLCASCLHVEVCAVLTAARILMPDGGFDVSRCAQFFPTPKECQEPNELP